MHPSYFSFLLSFSNFSHTQASSGAAAAAPPPSVRPHSAPSHRQPDPVQRRQQTPLGRLCRRHPRPPQQQARLARNHRHRRGSLRRLRRRPAYDAVNLHPRTNLCMHAEEAERTCCTSLRTTFSEGTLPKQRKHSQHLELELSQMSLPGPSLLLIAQWIEILSATCLLATDNPLRWQPQSNQPHCDAVTLIITLSIAMSSLSFECV
ncbi:hypothetical protein Fmac_030884 [Flemingia macrophylla]|uniref:Uncharacterized protein n=1 Tax=Flemingia macrophylla TaxID=520843 RepID=A0ABD1L0G6_9FABA